jgi:hypothetical protein
VKEAAYHKFFLKLFSSPYSNYSQLWTEALNMTGFLLYE